MSPTLPLSFTHTHAHICTHSCIEDCLSGDFGVSLYGQSVISPSALLAGLNLSEFGEFKETREPTEDFDGRTTFVSHLSARLVTYVPIKTCLKLWMQRSLFMPLKEDNWQTSPDFCDFGAPHQSESESLTVSKFIQPFSSTCHDGFTVSRTKASFVQLLW